MRLSDELEETLEVAENRAKVGRHEFVTPEHLLYALTSDAVASEVLRHCGADVEGLRGEVDQFLTEQMASLPEGAGGKDEPLDPGFSLGSQMVLQLAATHVDRKSVV